jgi:hypothetical protein
MDADSFEISISPCPVLAEATVGIFSTAARHAVIAVIDVAGRRVATLGSGWLDAGTTQYALPALQPGVYLLSITTLSSRIWRSFVQF